MTRKIIVVAGGNLFALAAQYLQDCDAMDQDCAGE